MAFRRHFLAPMFGMLLLLSVTAGIVIASYGYTQPGTASRSLATENHITVTEDLTFSWPIVVLIVVSAVGYGGVVWSVKQHHADMHVHLTDTDIAVQYPRRSECTLKHEALQETLAEIKESIKSIDAKLQH